MNKSIVLGGMVLLVVTGLIFVYFNVGKDDAAMQNEQVMEKDTSMADGEEDAMMETSDDAMMDDTDSMMEKDDDAMMSAGSYETYSPEKIALASSGDVVLFFRASWCPTCRAVDADIRANLDEIPAGLTILDVNYDDSSELKQKYGVTYQHTFVQVDAQGNQIKKWSGSSTLAELSEQVK